MTALPWADAPVALAAFPLSLGQMTANAAPVKYAAAPKEKQAGGASNSREASLPQVHDRGRER